MTIYKTTRNSLSLTEQPRPPPYREILILPLIIFIFVVCVHLTSLQVNETKRVCFRVPMWTVRLVPFYFNGSIIVVVYFRVPMWPVRLVPISCNGSILGPTRRTHTHLISLSPHTSPKSCIIQSCSSLRTSGMVSLLIFNTFVPGVYTESDNFLHSSLKRELPE